MILDKAATLMHCTLIHKCAYSLSGPFASAVANRFGCRTPAVLGSVIAAFFFFISTFVNSVDTLIFTYGIMGGRFLGGWKCMEI